MAKNVFADAMNETIYEMQNPIRTQRVSPEVETAANPDKEEKVYEEAPVVTEREMDEIVRANYKMTKKGRRRTYEEECVTISLNIPLNLIKQLDVVSRIKSTNRSRYIVSLIEKDLKKNEDIYQKYIAMFGDE